MHSHVFLVDSVVWHMFDQGPAFLHVCHRGYTDIMRRYLEDSRVDPTAGNNWALWLPTARDNWAIGLSSHNADVVKLLLADGRADPAAADNHAIRLSSKNGHTDVVKLLLEGM